MNNPEFSDMFTTLLNSHGSKAEFGDVASKQEIVLNEYEKSLYLTRAQDSIVIGLYNGATYPGHPFENTEEVTNYLALLVTQKDCTRDILDGVGVKKIFSFSDVYKMPEDLLFRTLETCVIKTATCGDKQVEVVPVTQDEVMRTIRNPFKRQNSRRVLRLTYGEDDTMYSELISDYFIEQYIVRYLRRPRPIILEDLPDGLTINGVSEATECELNPALHQLILDSAVQMALLSKSGNAK